MQLRHAGPAGGEPDHQSTVDAAKQDPLYAAEQWNCFCEIKQATNTPGGAQNLTDCQENTTPS